MIFSRLQRLAKKYFIHRALNKISLSVPVRSPTYLEIEPTAKCNLKCIFCSRRNGGMSRSKEDLSQEDTDRILTLFPELKYVNLQGLGETFLNHDLENIMKKFSDRNVDVWTVTNGTLLLKKKVRTLIHNYFVDVAISLDSADHDKTAELRPGGPDLGQILKGVETLVNERNAGMSNVLIGFNVTVSHENYHELPKIGELAAELGVDYILVANIENWFISSEEGYEQASLFADETGKQMEQIKNAVEQLQQRLRWSPVIVRHYPSAKRLGNCSWPFSSMFIASDGAITPCCIRMHTKTYTIGNIHNCKSIADIWYGESYSELRRAHLEKDESNTMCGRCPL
jgi:radical SAM protein with 4Fe4S-binding SPASM domain